MRSSTSSSEAAFERSVPRGRWFLSLWIAVVILVGSGVAREAQVRGQGYRPRLNDTNDLWAEKRSLVGRASDQTVLVGASRLLFDFDLPTYAEHFGTSTPIQLAIPGTNPLELLESVASEPGFAGTVLLGATEMLWFVPEGPPVENARNAVGRYENWSPSQKMGSSIGKVLQRRLALINSEDLTLASWLKSLAPANRPGTRGNIPPQIPPYFAWLDDHRQARMWEKCDFGTPLAERIQQIWIPLFTPPPPPPDLTEEEFRARMGTMIESHLERMRVAVEAIRARGGRVVWLRFPSTSTLREIEERFAPRAAFYDRMLAATGAPGIHFEDHPELAGFDCPEWSHLTADDAVRYTQALMPILERVLAER